MGAELVINGDFVDILASNSGIWASLMKPQALPEDDVGAMATILQL